MRIWTISDIHNDFNSLGPGVLKLPRDVEADVLVIAGDVGGRLSGQGRMWLEAETQGLGIPVLVVPGNHCYYGADFLDEVDRARVKLAANGADWIQILDGNGFSWDGVRFLGCPLWTDFAIAGAPVEAMIEAKRVMNDYGRIQYRGRKNRMFPEYTQRKHFADRGWLETAMSQPFSGSTVVISHHAPSARSLREGRVTRLDDAAYASDLESLIEKYQPDLWVHGHVHRQQDYSIGRTRVVANPLGYCEFVGRKKDRHIERENPDFDVRRVFEVPSPRPKISVDWGNVDIAVERPDDFDLTTFRP